MAMPSLPRLPGAAATEVMLRASTRRSSSSRRAPANPAASPAVPTARPQLVLRSSLAASRPAMCRSLSPVWLTSGRVVSQAARLADELRREEIPAGGQHLPELDEGDPAVLHGQAHRAGQPG